MTDIQTSVKPDIILWTDGRTESVSKGIDVDENGRLVMKVEKRMCKRRVLRRKRVR